MLQKLCMLRLLSIVLLMQIIASLGEFYKTSIRKWSWLLDSYVLVEKSSLVVTFRACSVSLPRISGELETSLTTMRQSISLT